MAGAENKEFLQSASRICFIAAALALVLAVVMFFLFDIRNIFLIETGRAKSKAIQEMNERNQRTGKLRDDSGDMIDYGGAEGIPLDSRSAASGKNPSNKDEKNKKRGREVLAAPGKNGGTRVDVVHRSGTTVEMASTSVLGQARKRNAKGFKIVQKTIVIHTDENIPA